MEFIDLKRQYNLIQTEISQSIKNVLEKGNFILGEEVDKFEEELSNFVGSKCVSCANGTDALYLALMARNIQKGDIVFTTPFTFVATAEVISLIGATPVFVDVENDSFNIDPKLLEKEITKLVSQGKKDSLKAIIAVDIFGMPASYERLINIAKEHNLYLIEDACQSLGASQNGRRTGNLCELAATSFFPAKPLGCYGDGGAIFCQSEEDYKLLLSLRNHGKGTFKYDNVRVGVNSRLDTIQAAILIEKLKIFPKELEARESIAAYYRKQLENYFDLQKYSENSTCAWAQFSLLSDNRNAKIKNLQSKNIPTAIYYPKPLHLQGAYSNLGYKQGDFPISEKLCENIFSIPMHPYLEMDEQNLIIEALSM